MHTPTITADEREQLLAKAKELASDSAEIDLAVEVLWHRQQEADRAAQSVNAVPDTHQCPLNPVQVHTNTGPHDSELVVYALDEADPVSKASHLYEIAVLVPAPVSPEEAAIGCTKRTEPRLSIVLPFQKGGIHEAGLNGVTNEALIKVMLHRIACFQASPYACEENEYIHDRLTEALRWIDHRRNNRIERGVYGTSAI